MYAMCGYVPLFTDMYGFILQHHFVAKFPCGCFVLFWPDLLFSTKTILRRKFISTFC